MHIRLVLEQRPEGTPHLPTLNKWQNRRCANCGATQTTGSFGKKAVYCRYLELLFCRKCRGNNWRPLPWRMIHLLDFTPFKVCQQFAVYGAMLYPHNPALLCVCSPRQVSNPAAEFLDEISSHPVVDWMREAPSVVFKNPALTTFFNRRRKLYEAVVRSNNTSSQHLPCPDMTT